MIRKYQTHTLQTNPRHHEKEPQNTNSQKMSRRQLKQINQLSLPHQDNFITIRTRGTEEQNEELNTEPPQAMGATINNESTTTSAQP